MGGKGEEKKKRRAQLDSSYMPEELLISRAEKGGRMFGGGKGHFLASGEKGEF